MINTCCFLIVCLTATGQNNNSSDCEKDFKRIYDQSRTVAPVDGGKYYHLRCRYVVLAAGESEPVTDTVEMGSDGKRMFYKNSSAEVYSDEEFAIYINKARRNILITPPVSREMMERKMDFSRMVDDSLFRHCRTESCREIQLEGKPCIMIAFNVHPDYRNRSGLRRMEYYIDKSSEEIRQVQLVYHNRPDVKRMLVIFDERGYTNDEALAGKAIDHIYERKKLKSKYAGYQVTDKTKRN